MKRRLIFTLAILTIMAATLVPPTPVATAQNTGENWQCPTVRQVCKTLWENMTALCVALGNNPTTCKDVEYFSYTSCVIQTSMELGLPSTCSLRDEFIVY